MIDDSVLRSVCDLEQPAVAAPLSAADVLEEVVADGDVPKMPAVGDVVAALQLKAAGCVADDVVRDDDVVGGGPCGVEVRLQHDRRPGLPGDPAVLEDVAVQHDAPRGLDLEKILDRPHPHEVERLDDVIAADHDVGRHDVRDVHR